MWHIWIYQIVAQHIANVLNVPLVAEHVATVLNVPNCGPACGNC